MIAAVLFLLLELPGELQKRVEALSQDGQAQPTDGGHKEHAARFEVKSLSDHCFLQMLNNNCEPASFSDVFG